MVSPQARLRVACPEPVEWACPFAFTWVDSPVISLGRLLKVVSEIQILLFAHCKLAGLPNLVKPVN